MGELQFGPGAMDPYTTNGPELVRIDSTGTGEAYPVTGWAFDASTKESLTIRGRIPSFASGLTVALDWYSRSGSTTGNVVWGERIGCQTPGDAQSMEAKTLATANTQTTAVNGTAKGLTRTTITISNTDSLASDDFFEMDIYRDAANGSDTMAGDAVLRLATVKWS